MQVAYQCEEARNVSALQLVASCAESAQTQLGLRALTSSVSLGLRALTSSVIGGTYRLRVARQVRYTLGTFIV